MEIEQGVVGNATKISKDSYHIIDVTVLKALFHIQHLDYGQDHLNWKIME